MANLSAPKEESHYNLLIKKTNEIVREIGDRIEELKEVHKKGVNSEFSIYQDERLVYLSFLNDILRTVIQNEYITDNQIEEMYKAAKKKYGVDRKREWQDALRRAYEYLTSEKELRASMRPRED